MNHLMIDIETLGTRPNAPILSIGAVVFDPNTGKQGATFYRAIDPANAFLHGVPDGDTFKWWMEQSDAARKAAVAGNTLLADALTDLTKMPVVWKDVQVWANDPDFDVTILNYAFHKVLGQLAPWRFWNTRSCRTIAEVAGKRPPKPQGVHHNALDDAKHQAKWVSDMWQGLRGKKATPATKPAAPAPVAADDDLL
ncbi:3'-5' exonuclease [Aquamicrobium zhengzhouense]|uniref:3'-5' exoribonuclease n=1 Tax=Aquamicrobium zhengzhouense TaxID=2781738 RepID=A0ABS0S9Y8_9HYPH|nr:3'-5' exonuclease [Aquamicrobium zhengzhouense]MBI1620089.1 3'-5' exoribonuclease [Aquamicrobium zhengzhouense]